MYYLNRQLMNELYYCGHNFNTLHDVSTNDHIKNATEMSRTTETRKCKVECKLLGVCE